MELAAADRLAIGELNARFAFVLDHHDYDALRELLAPDVHYASVGREFHDLEAVIASFRARTGTRTTRHALGNAVVTAVDEDRASGWSTWTTFASNEPGRTPPRLFMVADFADRYRRDASGGWRIAERIITPVFRDDSLAPN